MIILDVNAIPAYLRIAASQALIVDQLKAAGSLTGPCLTRRQPYKAGTRRSITTTSIRVVNQTCLLVVLQNKGVLTMSLHNRTSSYNIPPGSAAPSTVPRKRNLSASAIPLRPPPNLRTSAPSTPLPVKEEEISDNENDGKDDYGDLGVTGENREEQNKEERERLK